MKIKNILMINAYLIILFFLVQSVSALTANSSNYSVSMFGTGLTTANPSSTNYNAAVLSEAKGTTRNAESNLFTGNTGFFENTIYYRTVSITSYSISPNSAVIGSTIGLYISALNAQSVWAKITSPNSQEQTLNLINGQTVNYVPSPSVVGTYGVIFYANSSTGVIASVVSSFELTAQTTTLPSGGSSGGGGTTTIIEKCTYNWDCTPWSLCSDGKQTRECKNTGTCEGNESKPIEEMQCSEALFDIALELKNVELSENKTLKFSVNLTEKIGVDKIDVHIKYSVINANNTEIFSQIETRAIQGNLTFEKEIIEMKLSEGEYILRVDVLYGNLQRGFAEQTFRVGNKETEPASKSSYNVFYLFILRLGVLILILLLILAGGNTAGARLVYENIRKIYNPNKDSNREIYNKIIKFYNEILKSKPLTIFLVFVGAIVLLFPLLKLDITQEVIGTGRTVNDLTSQNGRIILIPLIICILALLAALRKKIIGYLFRISNSSHKYPKNSVRGLIGKKVYSENGDYLGKVEDVVLGENRIENLKIRIDKKHKFKAKGISINYKQVKSVGEVIIIDEKTSEHMKRLG